MHGGTSQNFSDCGRILDYDRIYWTVDTAHDYNLQYNVTHTSVHSHVLSDVVW
jgi:hypothetical protein